LRIGTETCTLVTILELKESEKGNNDSESSLLETETEAEAVAFSRGWGILLVCGRGGSLFEMI
jgi:hypothetical protein